MMSTPDPSKLPASAPLTPNESETPTSSSVSSSVLLFDGSQGEGGGQILRNAISFAALLQKSCTITNIRAGRAKPGLAAQHVACLQIASDLCGGTLTGASVGSTTIHYLAPSTSVGNHCSVLSRCTFSGRIGTAGSICLLLQAALPCALLATRSAPAPKIKLVLQGGTNATLAPQYDYWEHVFLPMLGRFGVVLPEQIDPRVVKRGYFPRGGGEVVVQVEASTNPLKPISLIDRGSVESIFIRSFHAGALPRSAAQEMSDAAKSCLDSHLPNSGRRLNWRIDVVTETHAVGSGSGILVVAKTSTGCILAGSALGSPKVHPKSVGDEAARELWHALQQGGCVDEWLQDQLILWMALADGVSTILVGSLTLHTRTAILVAERFSGARFEVEPVEADGSGPVPRAVSTSRSTKEESDYGTNDLVAGLHLIRCHGIGFQPR